MKKTIYAFLLASIALIGGVESSAMIPEPSHQERVQERAAGSAHQGRNGQKQADAAGDQSEKLIQEASQVLVKGAAYFCALVLMLVAFINGSGSNQ